MTLPNPLTSLTSPPSSRMRVGVVQASPAAQADFVWVMVDGAVVQAAYFTGYVPVPGDRVIVTQDGTDWFVLGGRSGYSGNLLANPDFLQGPHTSLTDPGLPYHWNRYTASGSAGNLIFRALDSDRGKPMLGFAMQTGSAGDNAFYSAAAPVSPGDVLYGGYAGEIGLFATFPTVTLTMRIAWFSDATSLYPNFVSESVLTSDPITGFASNPVSNYGNAVVPGDAAYARLVMRMSAAGGSLNYNFKLHHVELTRS